MLSIFADFLTEAIEILNQTLKSGHSHGRTSNIAEDWSVRRTPFRVLVHVCGKACRPRLCGVLIPQILSTPGWTLCGWRYTFHRAFPCHTLTWLYLAGLEGQLSIFARPSCMEQGQNLRYKKHQVIFRSINNSYLAVFNLLGLSLVTSQQKNLSGHAWSVRSRGTLGSRSWCHVGCSSHRRPAGLPRELHQNSHWDRSEGSGSEHGGISPPTLGILEGNWWFKKGGIKNICPKSPLLG
jgi:hypothetical protein